MDNDETFAKMLMEKAHIKVLPGRYLSRDTEQGNPGANHVRMALVADLTQCEEVVKRLKRFCKPLLSSCTAFTQVVQLGYNTIYM